MRRHYFYIITALLLSLSCGTSVTGTIVSGVIAEKVGSDLIEKARSAGAQLLAGGRETANASIIRAGNEILVAADAAARIASNELDGTVAKMSEQNRRILQGRHDLTDKASQLSREAFRFKDAAVLDLRSVFASLPLIGETFYIQRIDGVAQIAQEADYRLEIMGVGLGSDSQKNKSEIRVAIDGQTVPNARIQRNVAHTATIWIPNSVMERRVIDKSVALISASLEIERRILTGIVWKSWKSDKYWSRLPLHSIQAMLDPLLPNLRIFDMAGLPQARNGRPQLPIIIIVPPIVLENQPGRAIQ